MTPTKIRKPRNKSQYSNYKVEPTELQALLEQYRIYVEMADKNAERRQTANSFFLALNTAVIGTLGFFQTIQASPIYSTLIWVIPAAGISLSIAWHRFISSYRKLSEAKFKIIHSIEEKLPLKPYTEEWALLKHGKVPNAYLPYTKIESAIPIVFVALNSIALLNVIPWRMIFSLIKA